VRSLHPLCWLLFGSSFVCASAQAGDYRPPRLADGQVDLQGIWGHTNLTPFERPADLKTLVITREQADRIEGKIAASNADLSKPAEPALYFDERHVEPIRGELRSSIVVEPANGLIPGNAHFLQLQKQTRGSVLTAFDGPEQRPGSERCVSAPSAAPPSMLVPATDLRQIVQTPQAIVISSEELHEARVIRMNAKHAPAAVVSWLGDSIGWWEGETLVIETTNFAPTSATRMSPNGLFFVSPRTIVQERLTRTSNDELSYTFTVEDPTYYTAQWRGETIFHRSDARMLEYACHEGNYSLGYALQAARVLEQSPPAAEAKTALTSPPPTL
jgi:hypothetical protein